MRPVTLLTKPNRIVGYDIGIVAVVAAAAAAADDDDNKQNVRLFCSEVVYARHRSVR